MVLKEIKWSLTVAITFDKEFWLVSKIFVALKVEIDIEARKFAQQHAAFELCKERVFELIPRGWNGKAIH